MEIIVAVDGPMSKEGNPKAYRTTKVSKFLHPFAERVD